MSAGYWLLVAAAVVLWLWLVWRLLVVGDFVGDDPDEAERNDRGRPW